MKDIERHRRRAPEQVKPYLSPTSHKIVVLGLGNLLFSDEGMGIHAIRRILREGGLPTEVDVVDGNTMGIELLNHVESATHLLIIDAVDISGKGGSLCTLKGKEIPMFQGVKISQHQQSFKEILGIALLRRRLPEHLALVGVQPVNLDWGTDLSAQVDAAMEEVLDFVWGQLAEWGVRLKKRGRMDGVARPASEGTRFS